MEGIVNKSKDDLTEEDMQKLEDMLKPEPFEFQHKYRDTNEYKTLYDRAKEVFPALPPFLIQMALLSHLEETHTEL